MMKLEWYRGSDMERYRNRGSEIVERSKTREVKVQKVETGRSKTEEV